MASAKFCPECGTPTEGAKFCPECGTPTALGTQPSGVTIVGPTQAPTEPEREVWRGSPDPVLHPVNARTTTYIVTTERIRVESGSLRKRGEYIELFRVKDVSVRKSLTQRGRGRGDLVIRSTDPSTPVMRFESIEKPDEVAETVREVALEARKQHGVGTLEGM